MLTMLVHLILFRVPVVWMSCWDIQRSFNNINQSDTSVMDSIGDTLEVIVPYYGVTQK